MISKRLIKCETQRSLVVLGHADKALPVLIESLSCDNFYTRHYALECLDFMGEKARPALAAIRKIQEPNKKRKKGEEQPSADAEPDILPKDPGKRAWQSTGRGYNNRMIKKLLKDLG